MRRERPQGPLLGCGGQTLPPGTLEPRPLCDPSLEGGHQLPRLRRVECRGGYVT